MVASYEFLRKKLREDLRSDPFKRLGKWADFLTNRLYFAVFVHPDSSSAYQVYEVINTRGKELTTADLLKNYVLSEASDSSRQAQYKRWKEISKQFSDDGNSFVQFIRHAVTVESGHVLPKDLFGFLAGRVKHADRRPPSTSQLMKLLERHLPLYLQMMDPTVAGPAKPEALEIFSALNSLGVIAVRPILLAVANTPDSLSGMKYVLRLVVRRIIVGSLGTGNVERRFPYASRLKLKDIAAWRKQTKTPPGFRDEGDGDFFIWADFLSGLQLARANGQAFTQAILVTRDNKVDWSRSGTVHPILAAEMKALLGIHFEIWSDDKLSTEITKALTES
jgi:PIN like domain